jgi:anti-sigma regulatory factor (Ser/Thr protein kinase)
MARNTVAELKIPAQAEFINVAKRVASSLGGKMGFSLEDLDELNIAVTQACDSAIEAGNETWGGGASLKLVYSATSRGMEVEVEVLGPRSPQGLRRQPLAAHDEEVRRLTHEMIRCFVDDFRTHVDAGTGRVRFRMVKYLIS